MADTATDCRTPDGVTVGLLDGIIAICRVLVDRDLSSSDAVRAALADLRSDGDVLAVTEGQRALLARMNRVARESADLRDERDTARAELAEERERHQAVAMERDLLSLEVDDLRAELARWQGSGGPVVVELPGPGDGRG